MTIASYPRENIIYLQEYSMALLLNNNQKITIHNLKFPFWVRQYIGKLENGTSILVANSTQKNNGTFSGCSAWQMRYPFPAGSGEVATDSSQTLESLESHLWILVRRQWEFQYATQSIFHGITLEYFTYTLLLAWSNNQNLWFYTFKERYY